MHEIIGRDTELATIEAALDPARPGSRAVLLEGEAGIGKSTIWAEATARASAAGWRVLAARAVASESGLTLAILADLLGEIEPRIFDALPGPQRQAIDAAILRISAPRSTADPRLLGTALRSLLSGIADARPVLIAIDDIQWMDVASGQAIAFALRRLPDAPVALLGSRRIPLPVPIELGDAVLPDRLTRVAVPPVSMGTLHLVLKAHRAVAPSRASLVRIHEASGGNPLFALEIARLLDDVGEPPAGDPLPIPDDLRDLLQRRLAPLDAPVLDVLLDAALLGRTTVDRLHRAAGRDIEPELQLARADGIIRDVDLADHDAIVAFTHPLHAAAVLRAMPPSARRLAHARLAASAEALDEHARHAALAVTGPDERVAAELDTAADAAVARAAPTAAAELLRLAIERTLPDDDLRRAERRLALGIALARAGDTDGARSEFERVAAEHRDGARARARLELAAIHYDADGSTTTATRLCEEAIVDAAGDTQLQARAWATLAVVDYEDADRKRRATTEAARLIALVDDPSPATQAMVVLQQAAARFLDTGTLDPDEVREGLRLDAIDPAKNVSARFGAALGTWLKESDDLAGASTWLRATLAAAEAEGDEASLPFVLNHLAQVGLLIGAWSEAEALAHRHMEVATDLHVPGHQRIALLNLAAVEAHRGRIDDARRHIEEALGPSLAAGDDWAASQLLGLLGFLELSTDDAAAAAAALERAALFHARIAAGSPPRRGEGDVVEALVALGRLDEAQAALATLEAEATRLGWHSLVARQLRAKGLLLAARGQLQEAGAALGSALAEHDQVAIPFERARTLLILGQVRRRLRQRGAARDAFVEARLTFDQLGAVGWAARTDAELARTGLRRRSRSELTESERRVAELAAAGRTNREVAAALFMSPKTVGANLARAYEKLGIRSRAELGAVIARSSHTNEEQRRAQR